MKRHKCVKAAEWLTRAVAALDEIGDADARVDARYILSDALQTPLGRLFMVSGTQLAPDVLARLDKQLLLRLAGKPLQYAQGKAYFMGYEFLVDERVLIPRQDSELLCELAIARVGDSHKTVLDACTGSGAVAIAVALKCPNARVFASDISSDALDVARINAMRLGADVVFAQGDFLNAFDGDFDVITCNPPYLSREDMLSLQREVRFEPEMALYGGSDGLDFYKRAVGEASARLKKGGVALFEIGMGQAEAIAALGREIKLYKDLNGIDRVVEFGGF